MKKMIGKVLLSLGSFAISIFIIIGASEIYFRLIHPFDEKIIVDWKATHQGFIVDPHLIFRPKPNIPDITDAHGFHFVYPRQTVGQNTILMVGDSFVQGVLPNPKDNLPDQLQRLLLSASSSATVINTGSFGFNTDQELVWLKEFILGQYNLRPKIVIWVIYPANDLPDNYRWPLYDVVNGKLTRRSVWWNGLWYASLLARYLPKPLLSLKSVQYLIGMLQDVNYSKIPYKENSELRQPALTKITLEIQEALALSKQYGFSLVIVLPPEDGVFEGDMKSVFKKNIVKEALVNARATYFDAEELFEQHFVGHDKMGAIFLISEDPGYRHLTAEGNAYFAELLENYIKNLFPTMY